MDRRGFLFGTSIITAAAVGGLAGCSDGSSGGAPRDQGSGELPTRIPHLVGEPDLPELEGGVPAGYFSYPEPEPRDGFPVQQTSGPITTLLQGAAAVAAKDRNTWWQQIEQQSGFTFDLNSVQSAEYKAKLQVTLAGGEVPDVVQIVNVPGLPQVLDKFFADLTPFLAGDAVKEFPGLASIPTEAWQIPQVEGRIWGIPQPRPPAGRICSYRGDLFAQFGITEPPELRDGKDFLDLCAQVTDAKRARFALGADVTSWILPAMLEMHEAPNGWALEGDTLVHAYETEQMKAALDQTARLLKLGYLHPDSPSAGNENYTWWQSGRTSMYLQSFAGWATYGRVNPDWRLGVIKLPKWEGDGPAPKHLSVAGYTAWVAIKKAEEDRVREVLRFADFVASPFGTSAELLINYGVEGTHFTLKGTDPVPTEQAKVDKPTGLDYFGGQASSVLYLPDARDLVQQQYDYLAEVLPTGVQNPTEGLHSETSSTTGSSATRPMADLQTQIILGRKPLSDWDEAVDRWRQEAGDQQRQEYLEQLQDQ